MAAGKAMAVLIIPGLRDHVEDHWQTFLAKELAPDYQVITVPPLQQDKLNLTARLEAIQHSMAQLSGKVVVVAHSAGCLMLVHWAKHYALLNPDKISAALLVTPPDIQQNWPAQYPSPEELSATGWAPLPTEPLPFPALVVSSSNDHLASAEAVERMARQWNAALLPLGAVGHLNPASGYGHWPLATTLVRQLAQAPQMLCRAV